MVASARPQQIFESKSNNSLRLVAHQKFQKYVIYTHLYHRKKTVASKKSWILIPLNYDSFITESKPLNMGKNICSDRSHPAPWFLIRILN